MPRYKLCNPSRRLFSTFLHHKVFYPETTSNKALFPAKAPCKTASKNPGKARHKAAFPGFLFGATDLIRTGDLLITSELLYQLSHSSRFYIFCNRQYFIIFPAFCQGRIFSFRPAAGAQSGSIHKPPCSTRQKPARYSPAGHASSG